METATWFAKLLPENGYKVLLILNGKRRSQIFKRDTQELATLAHKIDSTQASVYFALASFDKDTSRKKANAMAAKSFWLDIDCGEGKPYATQRDGAKAVLLFAKATGLPRPMLVSSGNGLHVYWPLITHISKPAWEKLALILKQLTQDMGLHADPSRTADISSVLRPVGTHHKKGEPKLVKLMLDADPIDPREIATILVQLAKKYNINPEIHTTKETVQPAHAVNAALAIPEPEYKDSNPLVIANKCKQIGNLRDTKGDLPEPLWYAGLGVVAFCIDGKSIAHQWSNGYDGYTEDETDRKLEQLSKVAPTTCDHFQTLAPELCKDCKFKGRVTSPISLGIVVEAAPEPEGKDEGVTISTPFPYKRAEDGLYIVIEDVPVKFYSHDLYPVQIVYDEHFDYEQTIIRHKKPVDGWCEFRSRTAVWSDTRASNQTMADNGIIIANPKSREYMAGYIMASIKELQQRAATHKLYSSFGWKNDNKEFILGKYLFKDDGEIIDIGVSERINSHVADKFRSVGDIEKWRDLSLELNKPGMEGHLFALLCGFAAPLMPFTRLEGVLVNMLGESGSGKSTMQAWVNSIYGHPYQTMGSHRDTENAKFSRAAMYSNLPVTIDEITNMDAMRVSDFIYGITQGRDKDRLTRIGTMKENTGTWNTIMISSSNESLMNKLASVKANPEAEVMRLFEYWIPHTKIFESWFGEHVSKTLTDNYGIAGRTYINYLVQHSENIQVSLDKLKLKINNELQLKSTERYWSACIATAILSGAIAKKLGLIEFDSSRIMEWLHGRVSDLRGSLNDNRMDAQDLLGQYLNSNLDTWLVVNSNKVNKIRGLSTSVDKQPVRELHIREERHTNRMYIDRVHFVKFLESHGAEWTKFKADTMEMNLMTDHNRRIYLGKGTDISSPQIRAFVINLKNPLISGVVTDAANMIPEGDTHAGKAMHKKR